MAALRTATTATMDLEKISVQHRLMDCLALMKPRVVVMVLAVTVDG